jgi:hypothetical protein
MAVVELYVKPLGRASERLTPSALPIPAAFAAVIVYVAEVPEGVLTTAGVLVVLVTVTLGRQAELGETPGTCAAVAVPWTPAEPEVDP